MAKPKPPCMTVRSWLQANLGKSCLAPLTGTDARALAAAVQVVELYSYCPEQGVAEAFGKIVSCMQRSTQRLAYHAIAHVMDWSNRSELWSAAGLPMDTAVGVCAFEPGGAGRQ